MFKKISTPYKFFVTLQDHIPNGHAHIIVRIRDFIGLKNVQALRCTNSVLHRNIQDYIIVRTITEKIALKLDNKDIKVFQTEELSWVGSYHNEHSCMRDITNLDIIPNTMFGSDKLEIKAELLPRKLVSLKSRVDIINLQNLPDTLHTLVLGVLYQDFKASDLPRGLKKLVIQSPKSFVLSDFPPCLEELELGDNFNHYIDVAKLPRSLKKLVFGYTFNQAIEFENLPANLQKLQLSDSFEFAFNLRYLPRSLKSLYLGKYDRDIEWSVLPHTIEYLYLGRFLSRSFKPELLPAKLKTLSFGWYFADFIDCSKLPRTLTNLHLPIQYNIALNYEKLPKGMKCITFGQYYEYQIDCSKLPKELEYLSVSNYTRLLNTEALNPDCYTCIGMTPKDYNKFYKYVQ